MDTIIQMLAKDLERNYMHGTESDIEDGRVPVNMVCCFCKMFESQPTSVGCHTCEMVEMPDYSGPLDWHYARSGDYMKKQKNKRLQRKRSYKPKRRLVKPKVFYDIYIN